MFDSSRHSCVFLSWKHYKSKRPVVHLMMHAPTTHGSTEEMSCCSLYSVLTKLKSVTHVQFICFLLETCFGVYERTDPVDFSKQLIPRAILEKKTVCWVMSCQQWQEEWICPSGTKPGFNKCIAVVSLFHWKQTFQSRTVKGSIPFLTQCFYL